MHISTRLATHHNLHILQPRRASFTSQTPCSSQALLPPSKTEYTHKHIANLEKLLQKNIPETLANQHVIKRSSSESPGNRGRALLDGLNLARIWPEMKAAEEMSPRHLNRLQRLLSMNQEYSPRNNFGRRWREYHGSNEWDGLLDPLDENLRREIVRYGEFIQAAYHAFHSDLVKSAAPTQCHVALPDRSYKVTKSLYATSSIGLPEWLDDVASGWMTQRSNWIGYIAVCDDKKEIQQMGRRDIVIALRGTATCLEWAENMRAQLVPVSDESGSDRGQPKVECGFKSLYKTSGVHVESLAESILEEVRRLMDVYKGETLSISVTGHSLGAALALLVANELSTCSKDMPPIAVFSFGGPQVGNKAFAKQIVANNVKVLRIVNNQDLITRIPGVFLNEGLEEKLNSRVKDMLEKLPLAYSHVGTELRVDSKMSPYLKPNADLACCHDLEAYLHLVDGYLSSKCPFRANAKRSLARLLNDQKSNVKRLYTSNGKALSLSVEKSKVVMPSCLPSPS